MMGENIYRINIEEKEIILIPTAHVSRQSAEQVKEVIEREQPDSVCVELDEQRYQAITEGQNWKDMDIIKIIKQKKALLLLVNLIMSSFQKRMAKQFDINPGQEMIQGIESAKEVGANLILADRNIHVTFSRIWRNLGLWGKAKLGTELIFSIFNTEEITEEELEGLKEEDALGAMLKELADTFPRLKTPLVDERDKYLAQKIRTAPGNKVVAILGAAHVPGVREHIKTEQNLRELSHVPPKSNFTKFISWLIPILIIGIIGSTFYFNRSSGIDQTISWVLWNGGLSALGAILAFGHILTIATAFIVAPISSLNPLIAAGWFAGLVEAIIRKPSVKDFENLSDDVFTLKGFWRNKVTRVLLVVVLTNLGSVAGTTFGGIEVVKLFIKTFIKTLSS